jgi:hypothetical protein
MDALGVGGSGHRHEDLAHTIGHSTEPIGRIARRAERQLAFLVFELHAAGDKSGERDAGNPRAQLGLGRDEISHDETGERESCQE